MVKAGVVWVTGFSGSGKSSVSRILLHLLKENGVNAVLLDGDDLRKMFSGNWGYTKEDRIEAAKVYLNLASYLSSQGTTVIMASIAMFDEVHTWARENLINFYSVYLDVPNDVLLQRCKRKPNAFSTIDSLISNNSVYDVLKNPTLEIENYGDITPDLAANRIFQHYTGNEETGGRFTSAVKYWNKYYSNKKGVPHPSPFAMEAEKLFPRQANVLEVACGNGRDSLYFDSQGHSVMGIDTSEAAISLCQSREACEATTFHAANMTGVYEKCLNSFDVIYCRWGIHAMGAEEAQNFLEHSYQCLREGGRLFIECRSINDPFFRDGEVLSPTERACGHYRRFIDKNILNMSLEKIGFAVEHSVESNGLAVHKDDDPLVVRIHCVK